MQTTLNINEFAALLNGRQIGEEMTPELEKAAKELGFVVIFGASDDLAELRGAVDDEVGCYGEPGFFIPFVKGDLFRSECEDDDCPHEARIVENAHRVETVWSEEAGKPLWSYKTDIPHAKFNIMEDGEVFCEGIVFSVKDIA